MSITINGATNTLTAASGLAIAGNTAVTGTLSATGVISSSGGAVIPGALGLGSQNYLGAQSSNTWVNAPSGQIVYVSIANNAVGIWQSTGLAVTGTLSATGITSVTDVTDATSTTAASLKTAGGLAVAKKLYVGDNIVMASGKGIDFSDTANGSGTKTSELLNDYEEGTFTATVAGSGTAGTYEIASQLSTYTKVGRQVTIASRIIMAAAVTGGGTNGLRIAGMPFTKAANTFPLGAVYLEGVDYTATASLSAAFDTTSTSTTIYFIETNDNAAQSSIQIAGVAANDVITFSITYFV
jgi:hypothetical protein